MNLKMPRLPRSSCDTINNMLAIPLQDYTGPRKMNPRALAMTSGIPFAVVCFRIESLAIAEEKDTKWLNELSSDNCTEWSGFNTHLAWEHDQTAPRGKTVFLLGHLLDSPPSHLDTVFTSPLYMKKSLTEQGMLHANLSMDMQLYAVAQQIK